MVQYTAGQRIRGSEINALPQIYRVATPQFCPNSTVLRDITGLAFQGDAGGWYLAEAFIAYHADINAEIKFAWQVPSDYTPGNGAAGTGSWWSAFGLNVLAGSSGVGDIDAVVSDSLGAVHMRNGGSVPIFVNIVAFIQLVTGGTCKLQFAQGASNAHNTTVRAGSSMRVTKMN